MVSLSWQSPPTRVSEEEGGKFILTCKIGRIQGQIFFSIIFPLDCGLSNLLEIVNVTINDDGRNAKNAIIYIRYNLQNAIIVRRALFKLAAAATRAADIRTTSAKRTPALMLRDTGCFMLVGQTQSSEIIPKHPSPSLVAN
ncbi:hypothetical protein EUTSA_v10005451mg [Eutrema salsugineum]|uniref:Uncharacterized protein n=1 Tax=Eutrema salsugineum TaxID=72664 RepID=V4K0N9_EUTSA|nr:hypothetical protein EUTSA_v10005451mg [Eutrema salsugineum]